MSAVAFLNTFSATGKSISRLERQEQIIRVVEQIENSLEKVHQKFKLIHFPFWTAYFSIFERTE